MKQNLSNDDFNAVHEETIIASELQATGWKQLNDLDNGNHSSLRKRVAELFTWTDTLHGGAHLNLASWWNLISNNLCRLPLGQHKLGIEYKRVLSSRVYRILVGNRD